MVARTRKEPDVHMVEFRRDGEEPQREIIVGNGSREACQRGSSWRWWIRWSRIRASIWLFEIVKNAGD